MISVSKEKTALVLGATGGVGGAIADALVRHGWHVRAMARDVGARSVASASTFEWLEGDAMVRDDVVRAADGMSVIVHAVNPPGYRNWGKLVLPMMANSIEAARSAGGARIVLPGTVYNYDVKHTPLVSETTPQTATTRKGKIRIQMEQMLRDAAPDVPSLILRAGDFFGPGARSSWFAQAMVKPGRPVTRLVNPAKGAGHSWAYLPDLAEAFAALLDAEDRLLPFEVVQFAGLHDASGQVMTEAIRRVIRRDVPVRSFPWWVFALLSPFGGFPREAWEIAPHWAHSQRFDNARLKALLGEEPQTDLDEALRRTLIEMGCLAG